MVGGSRRAHCCRACDRPRWHFPNGCPAGGRLGRAVPSLGSCHSVGLPRLPAFIPLGTYVCTLCVCVCISGRMRAQFVRMYVYVGQTEGGMVPLSTGWPRTGYQGDRLAIRCIRTNRCRPLAFRNSSELLVSDTKLGTTLRGWSVLFIGACCLRGCPQAREVGGVEAIESRQPYWTHFLLLDVRFSRSPTSNEIE
ncbi:hypothetical protein F5883DRAFT_117568 [Diaporthe sp. PMI_573]|nr:hypothetical protein F5883DRAFT_117568 [Diaporthaceae sp. PMI_573]